MKGKLTFLGTGGSVGVPIIGCDCPVCLSGSNFNHRLRSSVLVSYQHKKFLIDAGPDFREQALRQKISKLDGVIFTHAHYDHTAGFDDLRPIYYHREAPFPVLLSKETAADIKKRFFYIFQSPQSEECINLKLLPDEVGEVNFEGVLVRYVAYKQGEMKVNGFRFGNLAYLTDIRHFTPEIWNSLKGVSHLIISALRFVPTPLHFSVDEAIDFADKVGAEKVWLTHLSHDLDYLQTNAYLPHYVRLAYDGLEIEFE